MKRSKIYQNDNKVFFAKIILFFAILSISAGIVLKYNFLTIKKINISPDNLSCTNKNMIAQQINLYGQNFFLVNEKKIEKNLKEKFLCIKTVEFKKNFPDKIDLNLSEREPAALIIKIPNSMQQELKALDATSSSVVNELSISKFLPEASESTKFLVDSSGFIFKEATQEISGLQSLYLVNEDIGLGKSIQDDVIQKIILLLGKLVAFQINVDKVIISGEKILVEGQPNLIFAKNSALDKQLTSLQLILKKAKIESKVINFIDLRFNKPTVIYSPKDHL